MPQKSDATVHILEKKATLFKRSLTPHWHVRFKAHGKWYRVTTKTDDLQEAKDVAVKIAVQLLMNLEAQNSAIYSGQLPFNYNKEIGKGTRCGLIKGAYSSIN